MTKITRCDGCGEDASDHYYVEWWPSRFAIKQADLCGRCMTALERYMKTLLTGSR